MNDWRLLSDIARYLTPETRKAVKEATDYSNDSYAVEIVRFLRNSGETELAETVVYELEQYMNDAQ